MNQSAKIVTFRDLSLFKSLTAEQINTLADNALYVKLPKNSIVYEFGKEMEYVYFVEKGSVKLGIFASCGKSLTKDIIYDSVLFGENIFSANTKYKEFAETMMDTRLFKIPIGTFRLLVVQNSAFANEVMNIVVTKLQNIEDRLQNFVFKKAKERIVDFIYRSGLRKGIRIGVNECLIDHGMSHKEIAWMTDTSRQTVARILNELKKEDYIHYGSRKSSKILIRDMEVMHQYKWVG